MYVHYRTLPQDRINGIKLCPPPQVTEIRIKYFDTVPVAASMSVLKTGFLFCASEFGNQ